MYYCDTSHAAQAGEHYVDFCRLRQEILSVARSWGITGNLFARYVPACGSLAEEMNVVEMFVTVQRDIPKGCEHVAEQMIRSLLFTRRPLHGNNSAESRSYTAEQANDDKQEPAPQRDNASRHPAIARATRQATAARRRTQGGRRR